MMIPNILSIIMITFALTQMVPSAYPQSQCECPPYREMLFLVDSRSNSKEVAIQPGTQESITGPIVMFFQDEIDVRSDAAIAMKKAYISQTDSSFIQPWINFVLTYPTGCPCRASPPPIGIYAAQLIHWLNQHRQVGLHEVHLIGWGRGAAICAEVARELARLGLGKVGRLTALDPIEKLHYDYLSGRRFLDNNDASFVDVIHTAIEKGSLKSPSGHADYYVNGGDSQLGCDYYGCDHARAWLYFTESVSDASKFGAVRCNRWPLKVSECGEFHGEFMGHFANSRSRGVYRVITNPQSPFSVDISILLQTGKQIEKDEFIEPCDDESQEFPAIDNGIENEALVSDNSPGHEDHRWINSAISRPDDNSDENINDSSCENEFPEVPVLGKLHPDEIAPLGYYAQDELLTSPEDFVDRPDYDAFQLVLPPVGYYDSLVMISGR